MKNVLIFIICLITINLYTTDYYVAKTGSDTNPGTITAPFLTISKAVNVLQPGDRCLIRGGTYHEEVIINTLNGTAQAPIIIEAYEDEPVILDGTEAITGTWEHYQGNIYRTQLTRDIKQLFVNDEMMLSARWPNARMDDGSIWDRDRWAYGGEQDIDGVQYEIPHDDIDLAGTNLSFEGAIALLNVGNWKTWTRIIKTHTAGTNHFTYDPIGAGYIDKPYYHRFVIEGKLNLLDMEKEWFYDIQTKYLYLWAPGGNSPTGTIRGKTRSYAMSFNECSYIEIRGLQFFADTIKTYASTNMLIEACDFKYPAYSNRMLHDLGDPDTTMIDHQNSAKPSNCVIRSCTFAYTDGPGIYLRGTGNVVENCYFHHIDYSAVNFRNSVFSIHARDTYGTTFRRNTLHTGGAAEGFRGGATEGDLADLVEYNHIYNVSKIQEDGSAIQIGRPGQPNVIVRYNWTHDSRKAGIRFDAAGTLYGTNGMQHHNVVWNTDKQIAKGDYHRMYNNTAFDNEGNSLVILDNSSMGGININTITKNNCVASLSGHLYSPMAVPGTVTNNWTGNIYTQLRAPQHYDFRPRVGASIIDGGEAIAGITDGYNGTAPDIGAYEAGDDNYWIPGHQEAYATMAIPPDGSTNVGLSSDLMWLGGYQATSHRFYLGTSPQLTANDFKKEQNNNIFSPGPLTVDTTYYWRVDSIGPNGTVTGRTWSFYTGTIPTPTPAPGNHTLKPTDDTFVSSFTPDTINGKNLTFRIRANDTYNAYIKFDVPVDNIREAKLYMRSSSPGFADTSLYMVSGEWDEMTLTYNTDTLTWGDLITTKAPIEEYTWYEFDLSNYITKSGTYTIGVKTSVSGNFHWYSNETCFGPRLEIRNIGVTPTPTPTATPTPTPSLINIAAGKPIQASSDFSPDFPITNAVDDNQNTVWGSGTVNANEWLFVDLQAVTEINGIGLYWFENYYAGKYSVYKSNNGKDWTLLGSLTKNKPGDDVFTDNISFNARYIGILFNSKKEVAVALRELAVYQL